MFLVIDIGNTNTVFAIYERLKSGFQLLKSFRIYSNLRRTPDEYSLIINQSFKFNNYNLKNIDGVAIASVVPEILNNLEIYFRNNLKLPIFKVEADKLNIEINIQNPNEAGQDRLINAFAVKKMKFDPAIIIDFGTATTFDVIGNGGAYLGGIISPGVNLSIESLYKSTSRLPKISLKSLDNEKSTLLGKSTISAIESGVFWGYVCMIEGLINKLKKYHSNSKVIATGGLSHIFKNNVKSIDLIEENLTINGLAYFYLSQEKDI